MKIHLIRHTSPNIKPGICYGQTDLDLANTFGEEKDFVHSKLDMPYEALFSSPLQRCSKLAETIDAKQSQIDERLMEYNFGEWEMRPWNEFKSSQEKQWMENFVDQAAPSGESILTMQARVQSFWSELISQSFSSVAIVTHSGVQRLIHADILQTPLTHMFRLQLEFGAVIEVEVSQPSGMQTIRHL